jgi:hypothetical protein
MRAILICQHPRVAGHRVEPDDPPSVVDVEPDDALHKLEFWVRHVEVGAVAYRQARRLSPRCNQTGKSLRPTFRGGGPAMRAGLFSTSLCKSLFKTGAADSFRV